MKKIAAIIAVMVALAAVAFLAALWMGDRKMARSVDVKVVPVPFAAGDPQVLKLGNILVVASHAAAIGEPVEAKRTGVYVVPKVSGAVIAQGETLTWDVSANSGAGAFDDNAGSAATGDVSCAAAFAYEASGNGVTTMAV